MNERIFSVLKINNKSNGKIKKDIQLGFNKEKTILLQEAHLLYILIEHPSFISSVVEKLATVVFSNDEFEELKNYIIESGDSADFEKSNFVNAVALAKKLSRKGWGDFFKKLKNEDVLKSWHDEFYLRFMQEAQLKDVNSAKKDLNETLDISTWERLKAQRIDYLRKKSEDKSEGI
jgi:hypothetical protein